MYYICKQQPARTQRASPTCVPVGLPLGLLQQRVGELRLKLALAVVLLKGLQVSSTGRGTANACKPVSARRVAIMGGRLIPLHVARGPTALLTRLAPQRPNACIRPMRCHHVGGTLGRRANATGTAACAESAYQQPAPPTSNARSWMPSSHISFIMASVLMAGDHHALPSLC